MKKKLLLILAFLLFTIPVYALDPPSWDLLNEDCTDISDWTDGDTGNGISEVSPAGQFHFITTTEGGAGQALRTIDYGSAPATVTLETKIYFDSLGPYANDAGSIQTYDATKRVLISYSTNGVGGYYTRTYDGSAFQEIGTNALSVGAWHTWRYLITFGDTMDVYQDNALVEADVDISWTSSGTNGLVALYLLGATTGAEYHMEWIKVATGLYDPTIAGGDDSQVISIL